MREASHQHTSPSRMTTATSSAPSAGMKICAYNLVPVRDPKRCSRCKTTHYADAEAQRAHWPTHKQVCVDSVASSAAVEAIGAYTCSQAFAELVKTLHAVVTLSDAMAPALLAPLFKRVKETLHEDEDAQIEMKFHTFGRQFGLFPAAVERSIDLFWACPGVVDCLLGEDLLTPSGRKYRRVHPFGLPSGKSGYLTAQDRAEFSFFERKRDMFDKDEYGKLTSHERKVHKYSFGLAHILTGTAIHTTQSHFSMNDGLGRFRKCHASRACAKKFLELWCDPIVRSICGAGIACGSALAFTVIHNAIDEFEPKELEALFPPEQLSSPGIAIDHLLLALLSELRSPENGIERALGAIEFLTGSMMAALNLGDLPDSPSEFSVLGWPSNCAQGIEVQSRFEITRAICAIGLERRAALALAFADNRFEALADKVAYRNLKPWEKTDTDPDYVSAFIRGFMSCVVTMCCVCSGLSKKGKNDCAIVMVAASQAMWLPDAASNEIPRPLCAPGKRFSGRAAFHWLVRRCDVHENVPLKMMNNSKEQFKATTDVLDVTNVVDNIPYHLMDWYAAKWPRQKCVNEDQLDRADEKLACLDLCLSSDSMRRAYHAMYARSPLEKPSKSTAPRKERRT